MSACDKDPNYPMAHPTNCQDYYNCEDNQVQLLSCPEGFHFNPVIGVCDDPETAGCVLVPEEPITSSPTTDGPTVEAETEQPVDEKPTEPAPIVSSTEGSGFPGEGDCSPGVQYLPHPTDCTKFFECSNGVPYPFDCNPGLHFNQKLNICDWPHSARCEGKSDRFEENSAVENQSSSVEEEVEQINDEDDSDSNEEGKPTPNDPMCPKEGHYYLPNPENCNQFYECNEGSKFDRGCPPNLHFNPTLEVCDWPNTAGCQSQKKVGLVNRWFFECPSQGYLTVPDPEDCTKFYICNNGQKNSFVCPPELLFNPVYEVCDWPANVNCATKRSRRLVKAKPVDAKSEKVNSGEEIPPIHNDPDCANGQDFLLPNPENCGQFFRCYQYHKYTFVCPDKLHFNPSIGICDWPAAAGCENRKYYF